MGETGAEVAGKDVCDPNDMDKVDRFVAADEGEEALKESVVGLLGIPSVDFDLLPGCVSTVRGACCRLCGKDDLALIMFERSRMWTRDKQRKRETGSMRELEWPRDDRISESVGEEVVANMENKNENVKSGRKGDLQKGTKTVGVACQRKKGKKGFSHGQ